MAITGKTGADAIFKAIKKTAQVLEKYRPKLLLVIDAAVVANAITADEATIIKGFLSTVTDLVVALGKLADYSGF
jgi:predicted DNA-binding protein YlxM (UPF0122 family)